MQKQAKFESIPDLAKLRNLLVNCEEEPKQEPSQGDENPRHKNNSVQPNTLLLAVNQEQLYQWYKRRDEEPLTK